MYANPESGGDSEGIFLKILYKTSANMDEYTVFSAWWLGPCTALAQE
jgi:hypothetical protein